MSLQLSDAVLTRYYTQPANVSDYLSHIREQSWHRRELESNIVRLNLYCTFTIHSLC